MKTITVPEAQMIGELRASVEELAKESGITPLDAALSALTGGFLRETERRGIPIAASEEEILKRMREQVETLARALQRDTLTMALEALAGSLMTAVREEDGIEIRLTRAPGKATGEVAA